MSIGNQARPRRRSSHRGRGAAVSLLSLALVLAGSAVFAMRGPTIRKAPDWVTAGPVAHRGDWTPGPQRPENSLAAFAAAVDKSLPIELDVQLTLDQQVIVLHDRDLARMTGAPGLVADLTLAQIRERRLLGGDQPVPTLAEVLTLVDGRVPLFVEIKSPPTVGPLEDAVAAQLAGYRGRVAVMSFNPFSVQRFAKAAPDITRGQLSGTFEGEDLPWYQVLLLRNLLMNWASQPDYVAMELELVPSATTTLQRWWGRPLLCWTAEDAADAARAAQACDAVIGDPGSR